MFSGAKKGAATFPSEPWCQSPHTEVRVIQTFVFLSAPVVRPVEIVGSVGTPDAREPRTFVFAPAPIVRAASTFVFARAPDLRVSSTNVYARAPIVRGAATNVSAPAPAGTEADGNYCEA